MYMNYLTPSAEVRTAGAKGLGVFAVEPIPAGTTVAAFGGYVVDGEALAELPQQRRSYSIQIDEDLYLASPEDPDPGDRVNHSCEPNCGIVGCVLVVAMRDIAAGEELTFDYAMSDGDPYDEFECFCGTPSCRGKVTGQDWMRPELQRRYRGWFSPYLTRRIAASVPLGSGRRAFAF